MDDKEVYEPIFAEIPVCRFDGGICRHANPHVSICKRCLESLIDFYKECLYKVESTVSLEFDGVEERKSNK